MQSLSIVIPAYNEQNNIAHAVLQTRDTFLVHKNANQLESFQILVVNDGSADETQNVLTALQSQIPELCIINHPTNLGKGAAVKTGVAAAAKDWILMLDADLSTHPREFEKFLPYLQTHQVIIGSRRMQGAKINLEQPWYRRAAGWLFRKTVGTILNLPYKDTQCGFKAFKTSHVQPIFATLQSRGWVFDVELLAKSQAQNLTIQEIPVEWSHGAESKVRLKDALNILREIHRIHASTQK